MVYVGLRAIAKRIGVSVWMVQRMADKLGLPIMMHPKTRLRGNRVVWCMDEEMYLRWLMAQARLDHKAYKQARADALGQTDRHAPRSPWDGPSSQPLTVHR